MSDNKLPQEDLSSCCKIAHAIQDLEDIVVRINRTNNDTPIEGYKSLMGALAKKGFP